MMKRRTFVAGVATTGISLTSGAAALAQDAGTATSGASEPATLTESGYIPVNGIIDARVRPAEETVPMQWLYLSLNFLHVAVAIVWIGGVVALTVLNARMVGGGELAVPAALGRQSEFIGRAVIGPAMLVLLVAGFATAVGSDISFGSFWIVWGLVGFVAFVAVRAIAVPRMAASPGDLRLDALLNALNILLLASVVWAMVFKPTL